MVCKNCGADLKPGIKYCLECGNYIDESEYRKGSNSDAGEAKGPGSYKFPEVSESSASKAVRKRKKKRKRFSAVDLAIYGALGLVIIVSVIIIIVTLIKGNTSNVEVSPSPTVVEDKKVTLDFYSVVIPGGYNYDISNSFLYVSDDVNYTFSYKNTTDDYKKYSKDLNILTAELEENKYSVEDATKEDIGDTEFLIYKLGSTKYLYLTPASKKYTSVGVIEVFDNGDWKSALPVIAKLNQTVEFDSFNAPKEKEDDEEEEDDEESLVTTETFSNISANLK